MPAIVKCPNGCKLRVPVRKLLERFDCPKCTTTIFVDRDQIRLFRKTPETTLTAIRASDLMEIEPAPDEVIYLSGEAANLLVEVVESETEIPEPPPVVDQAPSDAVFAKEADKHRIDSEVVGPKPPPVPTDPPPSEPKTTQSPAPPPGPAKPVAPLLSTDGLNSIDRSIDQMEADVQRLESAVAKQRSRQETFSQRLMTRIGSWFRDPENPGVVHNSENRWKAYSLGWAMVVIAILILGPIIYTMLQWIGQDYHRPLGRWAVLLVFFSAFQMLYALFLFQLPDWTATRFVSWLMLGMTIFCSFLLSIGYLSRENNAFYSFLELSIVQQDIVCGWLLVMSIVFGMMSYLCGRTTQLWMREEARRNLFA